MRGTIPIQGAKNALLPLMIAAIVRPIRVHFNNVTDLRDTRFLGDIIQALGGQCEWQDRCCVVDTQGVSGHEPSYEYVRKMRASFLLLGALLGRFGRAKIPLPGGCSIGERPVQWHIDALRKFGITIDLTAGCVVAHAPNEIVGTSVTLPFPTVGGTQNVLMVAAVGRGESVIHNAACEPEVAALCHFLQHCGVVIEGAGTSTIRVQGTPEWTCPEVFDVMPDRIETVTYAVAAAISKGDVILEGCDVTTMVTPLTLLESAGVGIEHIDGSRMRVYYKKTLEGFEVTTGPYPQIPTDIQAILMALSLYCEGQSIIRETVFSHRFMHALEFARMGADLRIQGDTVTVFGGQSLVGAPVMASDLRAGAAIVLAALGAQGESVVQRVYHVDRGYADMEQKLSRCGVKIERLLE